MMSYTKETKIMMNAIYNAAGKTIAVNGERRLVKRVRPCYGQAIELTLDAPLPGCTSPLFTVDELTGKSVRFV